MALWSNTDANTSAPLFIVDVITGNTGVQAFNQTPVGTYGVSAGEAEATPPNGHAGWVLRTVGSGGRTGRVTEETLVAMGSMDLDASDDTIYPDYRIYINSLTANQTAAIGNTVSFVVDATSVPGGTLAYQWYTAPGRVAIAGKTTNTLTFTNVQTANANTFYVSITVGDATANSGNTTLTVV